MKRSESLVAGICLVLGVAALFFFFYWPLANLVFKAAGVGRGAFVPDSYFWHVVKFTYAQAFLSACMSGGLGLVGAVLFSQSSFRVRRIGMAMTLIPFCLPPILVVLGLLGVWGRQGLLGRLIDSVGGEWAGIYGWSGLLLAHTFFNFPLFVRLVGQSLQAQEGVQEKTALSLGLKRWQCFWQITWPQIRSAFWGAWLLAFLYCSTSFLIVLVLGGGPAFSTIEVVVYQAVKHEQDLSLALSLAGIQLLVAALGTRWIYGLRPTLAPVRSGGLDIYLPRHRGVGVFFRSAYSLTIFLVVGLPLAWILWKGLPGIFPLERWWGDLKTSLALAFSAGALATAVALSWETSARLWRAGWLKGVSSMACTLPLAVSSVLVLLGWRLAYAEWFYQGSGVWWAVVAVQALVALPVVFRPVQEGFQRLSDTHNKVAASLGASRFQQVRWVEFPVLFPAILLAWLLGVAIALGEAGAVLLFLDDSTMNFTYRIYQSMSHYRFAEAYTSSAVLLLVTAFLAIAMSSLERETPR